MKYIGLYLISNIVSAVIGAWWKQRCWEKRRDTADMRKTALYWANLKDEQP